MFLFGGGGKKIKPQYTGLATQTSTSTVPVAIGFGLNRVAPNIIWQGDFKSHKQKQKTGKGGGQTVGYTYSGSFDLGLGWGPATGIRTVWKDQSTVTLSSLGMTLIAGNVPQSPWGFLTSNHPSQALGYPGLAQVVVANYDLGGSNTLSQHSFELEWPLLDTAPGGHGDADPARCVDQLLNSNLFGALLGQPTIPVEQLFSTGAAPTTGDAAFQTYCLAMGIGFSPLLDSQETCNTILERWALLTNTALCWTGYSLRFLPYGSETTTANGVTYLPDTTSKFAFADDDFLLNGSDADDPIIVRRKAPADSFNAVSLEFTNRANQYNTEPAEWHDQGLIDVYGYNGQSSTQAHEICDAGVAAISAQLYGQRTAYVRNEFEWVVAAWNGMQLVCGVIGTITDPVMGTLNVMLTSVVEEDDGTFRLIAEEYAASLGATGLAPVQDVTNTPINTGVAAAAVNTPLIFEPPSTLAGATAEVWFAISAGPSGTFDPNWGGCFVWLSSDNATYQQVGTIETPARMGVLGGTLASYGGSNPDTTHSVAVDLSESAGDLTSVTAADAAAAVTLCIIKDAGGTIELLSFRDATLTSTYHYTIGGQLYRGLYGTAPAGHVSGAAFARLDENIFKFALPAQWIGQTIYAKFQSFNPFGSGVQDLAACTAYSYAPLGSGFGGGSGGVPTTPATPTVSAQTGFNLVTWAANPTTDNVIRYDVFRATGTGQPFGSATLIGSSSGTSYTDSTATAGQGYTYFVKAVNAVGSSVNSTGTNITSAVSSNVIRFYGCIDARRPDAGEELFNIEMKGDESFTAGFPDNLGGADVAATATATFPIFKNGTNVGSMNFAAASATATWTLASGLTFAAGDRFKMFAPASPDATLSGVSYTFSGRRG